MYAVFQKKNHLVLKSTHQSSSEPVLLGQKVIFCFIQLVTIIIAKFACY